MDPWIQGLEYIFNLYIAIQGFMNSGWTSAASGSSLAPLMPHQLPSRLFSSETLVEGLGVIAAETGMDDLSAIDVEEMQAELAKLEAYNLGG